jgi:hypothetical protein
MKKIDIKCDVREYPDKVQPYYTMTFRNHWNDKNKIEITIKGETYTFIGDHIISAIEACKHAHSY